MLAGLRSQDREDRLCAFSHYPHRVESTSTDGMARGGKENGTIHCSRGSSCYGLWEKRADGEMLLLKQGAEHRWLVLSLVLPCLASFKAQFQVFITWKHIYIKEMLIFYPMFCLWWLFFVFIQVVGHLLVTGRSVMTTAAFWQQQYLLKCRKPTIISAAATRTSATPTTLRPRPPPPHLALSQSRETTAIRLVRSQAVLSR